MNANITNTTRPIQSPFDDFTLFQVRFASVASKIPALLSLWGSIYIIYDILGNHQKRQQRLRKAYYRIMLGLSISDCTQSFFGWFLTSWPQPKDTIHDNIFWGNVGNRDTCRAQGFIATLGGFCAAYYTAMLTIYYLLTIIFTWKENEFRKIEPFMHFGITGAALIVSCITLAADLFNNGMPYCYINSYPYWCEGAECIRGANVDAYEMLLFIVPVSVCLIIILASMGALVVHACRQDQRIERLETFPNEDTGNRNRLTKIVFKRALKYVGAYLLTWSPSTVFILVAQNFERNDIHRPDIIFAVIAVMLLISPLQGLLNALIYSQTNLFSFFKKSLKSFSQSEILSRFSQDSSAT